MPRDVASLNVGRTPMNAPILTTNRPLHRFNALRDSSVAARRGLGANPIVALATVLQDGGDHSTGRLGMTWVSRLGWLGMSAAIMGCSGPGTEASPAADGLSASVGNGATARVTGSGHHTRVVGGVAELTTFSFTAVAHRDGAVSGQYQYNFRANGFAVHGPVSCVTVSGNQAWVGGIVDRVVTDNPAFEALLGLEMWWRSIDNGEGAGAAPDVTTGLGFGFAGSTITAESWCRDQPLSLVAREVEKGNIQVR